MDGVTVTTEGPGVFLLGIGAQKAGTTWLHAQLNRRRDADFGFLKEYHVHDALTLPAAGFSNLAGVHCSNPAHGGDNASSIVLSGTTPTSPID